MKDVDSRVLEMAFFLITWIIERSDGCCLEISGNIIFSGSPGSPREVMDVVSRVQEISFFLVHLDHLEK